MKIQIASDLHFEIWRRFMPDEQRQFAPDPARDLLILAGDITDGKRQFGVSFIRRELAISPIIYVPGNHEYFHAPRRETEAFWRALDRELPDFHYLNDDTLELGGLRFYGALWCTDFWGRPPSLFEALIEDFHATPGWDPAAHLEENKRITKAIAGHAGKVDVVITHFPPTRGAIDPSISGADEHNNPYFVNDADDLVRFVGARLWVAGHTHHPFDYRVGATRVIGNPRGYPHSPPRPGFSLTKTLEVAP